MTLAEALSSLPTLAEAAEAARDHATVLHLALERGSIDVGLSAEDCRALLRTSAELRKSTAVLVAALGRGSPTAQAS